MLESTCGDSDCAVGYHTTKRDAEIWISHQDKPLNYSIWETEELPKFEEVKVRKANVVLNK